MQTTLEGSQLIELHGGDAVAFAQSQFMSDVASLIDGGWQWSGLLNPKGRIVAFFALHRISSDRLLLWLPEGGGDALCAHLQRFVFRSKVAISIARNRTPIAVFGDGSSDDASLPSLALPADHDHTPRRLLIAPYDENRNESERHSDTADLSLVQRWRLADLRLGIPYIAASTPNSEQFVPKWLSLERLNAFSLKKGCYPGQEIVARMHYLGQSKRVGAVLSGDGPVPSAMTRIRDDSGKLAGEIVWSQVQGDRWWALAAVINPPDHDSPLTVDPSGSASTVRLTTVLQRTL